jgi:hypothetical protein
MSFHVPDTSLMNVYPRKNQNDLFGPPVMETVQQLWHKANYWPWVAIWTEPLNVHLELSPCSSRSNIDTVSPQYVFYGNDKSHT